LKARGGMLQPNADLAQQATPVDPIGEDKSL
jgi:hypothetical protein